MHRRPTTQWACASMIDAGSISPGPFLVFSPIARACSPRLTHVPLDPPERSRRAREAQFAAWTSTRSTRVRRNRMLVRSSGRRLSGDYLDDCPPNFAWDDSFDPLAFKLFRGCSGSLLIIRLSGFFFYSGVLWFSGDLRRSLELCASFCVKRSSSATEEF